MEIPDLTEMQFPSLLSSRTQTLTIPELELSETTDRGKNHINDCNGDPFKL